ncbi:MAG: dTDP-4-dehydrorhamnose 3,5-epimerase [Flavobacteriia bacterium]|nr:dTDP-4-dehydrorhamnose 3,5-epimerase [Flavobacteriia bacterium]
MKVISEPLKDCFLLEPTVYGDHRGYFFESYNDLIFTKLTGLSPVFVQDNQSKSSKGVLRGLHFQIGEAAQAKLVRVISGSVWDVAVDIRPNSPTFKKWFGVKLSAKNHQMLFIPRGFAHGFITLEDDTIFSYKCDNHYSHSHERGIHYRDMELKIEWPIDDMDVKLSEKDMILPELHEIESTL